MDGNALGPHLCGAVIATNAHVQICALEAEGTALVQLLVDSTLYRAHHRAGMASQAIPEHSARTTPAQQQPHFIPNWSLGFM